MRNILYYKVEVKEKNSQEFTTIDSLSGTFNPPAYLQNRYYFNYQSKPVFNFRTEYALRFKISYRGGKVTTSNELNFVTPIERGKILRSLSPPGQPYPYFYYSGNYVIFSKGRFIVLSGSKIFEIDSSSGQATLLKDNFYSQGPYFMGLTSCGDTIFITKNADDYSSLRKYTILRFYLNTLAVDTLVKLEVSNKVLMKVLGHGSMLYLLWQIPNARQQFSVLDPRTGQTVSTLPDMPTPTGYLFPSRLCSDGTNFWTATNEPFDSKILQIDPSLFVSLKEYHNPVFSSDGLIWDGKNFWVVNAENNALVKLQLEGM
ncbi:MAG: hypothetical protein HY276_13405 [Ignavibacteriales bacterium]|nr:hypothetical protein [Ignavibacteriales bacterium]